METFFRISKNVVVFQDWDQLMMEQSAPTTGQDDCFALIFQRSNIFPGTVTVLLYSMPGSGTGESRTQTSIDGVTTYEDSNSKTH